MVVNAANIQAIFQNLRAEYNRVFDQTPASWQKIATLLPSATKKEIYAWLSRFPKMKKWVGDKHLKALAASDYSVINDDFEATVEVDRNDVEDDTLGIYGPMAQQAGFSAAEWPDDLVFPALLAGFTSLCYDGQYFFDTDHPVGDGSVSNTGGGSGTPWFLLDTHHPLKPIIFQQRKKPEFVSQIDPSNESVFMQRMFRFGVESRGNSGYGFWQLAYGSKQTLDTSGFDAAVALMMLFKDDEGQSLNVKPDLLITGPSNRAAGKNIIEVERLANGSTNPNYKAVELLIEPRLG